MKRLIMIGVFLLFFVGMANADISQKWQSTDNTIVAYDYPVTANVDDDPYMELFVAGVNNHNDMNYIVLCLDGNTGQEQWKVERSNGIARPLTPIELHDVDGDGIVELFLADERQSSTWGMVCLNGDDGSEVWYNSNIRPAWHHHVIIRDKDTNIPYLYVSDHSATIKKVNARTGEIVDSVDAGLTCNGGLSAADINNDGVVELIQAYHSKPGIQCFDTDLNLLWEADYDVDASTQTPTLIDVNEDGILDVFVCNQGPGTKGVEFFNGTNGDRMDTISNSDINIDVHEDSPIWDIDNDGNLEIVVCHDNPVKVVEISSTGPILEKNGGMGEWSDSPWMMDILGDSDMEIVGGQIDFIPRIWDSAYNEITDQPTIWLFPSRGLNDIDNDGLSEIFGCANGNIKAYDTNKPVIDGLNTQTMNFGYRRLDVATAYEPCPGTAWYSWAEWGANQTNQPPNPPSNPSPDHQDANVNIDTEVSWTGGDPNNGDTVTYDVYFGTNPSPPKLQSNQTATSYDPGTLQSETTYHWKIDAWDNHNLKTEGPMWEFTTKSQQNNPPNIPSNPVPFSGANNVTKTPTLYWTCGDPDGDTVTYDIYFGSNPSPTLIVHNHSVPSYNPEELLYSTDYYWRIKAWDTNDESTNGPIWTFTTEDFVNNPPSIPTNPNPANNADDIDIDVDISWYCTDPDGDTITYDIYFGKSTNPPLLSTNHPDSHYTLNTLDYSSTYYWKIVCQDTYGNTNESSLWSFTTLQTPNNPPLTPETPVGDINVTCTEHKNYTATTTDPDDDDIFYIWSWGDNSEPDIYGPYQSGESCTATHQWQTPGEYQITVKARDTHYRQTPWSQPLTITAQGLPTVYPNGPYSGFINQPIEFNGTIKNGFPPYTWFWEFGDNSYANKKNPIHTYNQYGDYTITVTVTDNRGYQTSNTTQCHIATTGDLNVIIQSINEAKIFDELNFTSSVEKGIPPYDYQWDFGDGTKSSQQNPTHIYNTPGTHIIKLTVTDSSGLTGKDTFSVTIIDTRDDQHPPTFEIIKPTLNSFYLNDNKILFWLGIISIGDITIEIDGYDDYSGIDYVEFYLDEQLQSTDNEGPYQWTWDKPGFGQHKVTIQTYDKTEKYSQKELSIWKLF